MEIIRDIITKVGVVGALGTYMPHRVCKKQSNAWQYFMLKSFSSNFSKTISAIEKIYDT